MIEGHDEDSCGKSGSAHISHLFILDWIHFVMSQPLLMINKKIIIFLLTDNNDHCKVSYIK
ncbi:hypothetical protein J7E64_05945 [Priestia megaterium]|nr:hypothetical protein [Priestia megaterium]